mgnify:FL=1
MKYCTFKYNKASIVYDDGYLFNPISGACAYIGEEVFKITFLNAWRKNLVIKEY